MRCARLALFGFGLFLCSLIWLADTGQGRWFFSLAALIPGGDKTGHFVLFGMLAFLVKLVLRATVIRCGMVTVLLSSLIVMVFVISEEVSQLFFVTRTFEFLDISADLLGIWTFGQLARMYLRRERGLDQQASLEHVRTTR
jgi:polysaccharide biosynthesis protein VpsQ